MQTSNEGEKLVKMLSRIEKLEAIERARLNAEYDAILRNLTNAEITALCSESCPELERMTDNELAAYASDISERGNIADLRDGIASLTGWIANYRAGQMRGFETKCNL